MKEDNNIKQFVYWLEPKHDYLFGQKENRSITMWATTPEEGLHKLEDWETKGYSVKFLYSMDDFQARMVKESENEARIKAVEARTHHAAKVETENV